ncbi:MAG: hypothetical protein LBF38_06475 [Deltaproteobacteria bacterium]|jgi:outer membrane biosynthesis protein TonB|nr:hypothetical protein [Deltaproteobacteria bacterium]
MSIFSKESWKVTYQFLQSKKYPIFFGLIALALVGAIVLFALTRGDPAVQVAKSTQAASPATPEKTPETPPEPAQAPDGPITPEPATPEPPDPASEPVSDAPETPAPAEPAAEAAPEPAPEAAPEPAVEPAAVPAAEATPEAALETSPEVTPVAESEPAAEPAPEAAPETSPEVAPVAQSEPAAEAAAAGPAANLAVAIGLSKVEYYPGEPILLNLIWAEGAASPFTVVVAELGAGDGEFKAAAGPGEDQTKVLAPTEPGSYEIKVYSGTGNFGPQTLLAKASIGVTALSLNAFNLVVIGEEFKPGSRIGIEVSGVSADLIGKGAFVGVFPQGAGNEGFIFSIAITQPNEELFVDLPFAPGPYEIRAYAGKKPIVDSALVAVVPIDVK